MFALPRVPRGPPDGGSSGSLARRRLASRLAPVAERYNTLIMCDYVKHAQIAEIHASPGTPVTVATHLRIQGAPVTEVMHVGRWSKQDSIGGYLRGVRQGMRGVSLAEGTNVTDFTRVLGGFLAATLPTPS